MTPNSIIVALLVIALLAVATTATADTIFVPYVSTLEKGAGWVHAYLEAWGYAMFAGQRLEVHCEGVEVTIERTHPNRIVLECHP